MRFQEYNKDSGDKEDMEEKIVIQKEITCRIDWKVIIQKDKICKRLER